MYDQNSIQMLRAGVDVNSIGNRHFEALQFKKATRVEREISDKDLQKSNRTKLIMTRQGFSSPTLLYNSVRIENKRETMHMKLRIFNEDIF